MLEYPSCRVLEQAMEGNTLPYQRIRAAVERAVGANQTLKAIQRGRARVVFVARDADRRVVAPVLQAARERGVEVIEVSSMAELGRACGIQVGAAAAAILEESG
ncbi:MAG: ribosomal L7Ae/L30e/S12e/Gadd45 family protein [Armatimonadota bacterium]|nr:ribosomal L7Ae/L30e/S12e/Gadd45 family protein [Armatimonadota bacterium]MDR5704196.1 ribosomal L7Ae/L30e/S12e/Gadd45 family protein [Armatimonadota bacterium]MDR7435295.1 ribosomal L7Ae/L30e/S12e/Gadd45 family protein [Armatimonadota bacterium]